MIRRTTDALSSVATIGVGNENVLMLNILMLKCFFQGRATLFWRHRYHLGWLLLLSILLITSCTPTLSQVMHPCDQVPTGQKELLLLAEAKQQLQAYLEAQALTAIIEVKEEGSFMLGAYPGARAFWSIRVGAPALAVEDTARLDDLALAAYCLRPGWVWLKITLPSGETTLVSYAQADLEELYQKKGAP
jgi:hypothetical protein